MEAAINLTPVALTLFVAFLGGFILHRLKQPALVGYMLVGALVGPALFHGSEPTIEWLAELAIILLMFMLGLELDIARFRRSMAPAMWVAGLQIALGLIIMMWLSVFFAWQWQLGILLGFIVAISSTAVAVSMLDNLGEANSPTGRLAVAILVAQDLAVVPMLLVISVLSSGSIGSSELIRLGFAVAVIGVSLIGIFELHRHPQWVARLERLFTAGDSQPVIAGLALAFGAAALSGAVGLSHAYGAFAVGLLVGNMGAIGASYRRAVHSIHDLLMMTFFLSVGLLLDTSFIMHHWVEILIVLAVTLFLKTAMNVVILRYFLSVSSRTSLTLGAVLGQIGEFSFVLIALGLHNGFIGEEAYQIALAVIALSLATSPVLLQLVQRFLHHRSVVPAHS